VAPKRRPGPCRGEDGRCGVRWETPQLRQLYLTSAPGSTFEAEGRHARLVGLELWERVQRRLAQARARQTYNKPPASITRASGLLRCAECGNAMVAHQRRGDPTRKGEYACLTRHRAAGACSGGGYRLDVAHAGLLAEVRRLRGAPWTQESVKCLMGTEGTSEAERVTTLRRALDDEHEALRRLQRRIIDQDQDPTPEERAAFSQIKAEIVARIRSLESQLHETSERATTLPDLRQLHERLTRIELATLVDDLLAQGDEDGLRELVLDVVQAARVVERWPKRRTTWVRVDVTWTPRVQELLKAGLLRLDAPPTLPPPPEIPPRISKARARNRRHYWRKHHPGVAMPDAQAHPCAEL
jgi:Recombinase zinc beta ribbon domain